MGCIALMFEIQGFDGYLIFAASSRDADLFYATRFLADDPFVYLKTPRGEVMVVSDMEIGRARKESRIKDIRPFSLYGFENGPLEVIRRLLQEEGVERVAVPRDFPFYLAKGLEKGVEPVESPFKRQREVKSQGEIEAIARAQLAAEKALETAQRTLRKARTHKGELWLDGGPFTSERLKSIIGHCLLDHGCSVDHIIAAGGPGNADPHWTGSGVIKVGRPIVIDLSPRLQRERYFTDTTRTFARNPSKEVKEMFEAVLAAQQAALSRIRVGVTGSEVHEAVVAVFEEQGYKTEGGEGFIHSTGHGVGLEVHEEPSLSPRGRELKKGQVVTVEPGLYYRDIGGVRLEDIVVVTRGGCKNLTRFPKNLEI